MSDGGPGAALRALVAAAVGDGRADPTDAVTVVERGDDPGPGVVLPALISRVADDAAGDASVVGVVPRIDPSLARRVAADIDAETRLVFTGSAADRLAGTEGAAVRSVLSAHGIDSYRHDGDSPVGVTLIGERAIVGSFDDSGLAAVLWSDAPPVREWAAATCRRFLAAADPV